MPDENHDGVPSRVLTELFSGRFTVEAADEDQLEEAKKWAKEVIDFCREQIAEHEEYYSEKAQPWDDVDREMYEEFVEEERPDLQMRIDHLELLLQDVEEGDEEAQHRLIMERTFESAGEFLHRRLLEVSFARKIIPPKFTPRDSARKIDHDTLVRIVDVEPKSKAMAITFRGEPTASFTRKEREDATENE